MSERVSDERLKVMTREGYRLASGSFVDEEIAAMASELIERRAADRLDDNEPITAEWWLACFDSSWFGWVEDDAPWFLERDDTDSSIELCVECGDGDGELWLDLPHIRTRGDLRRLWWTLTGKELGS